MDILAWMRNRSALSQGIAQIISLSLGLLFPPLFLVGISSFHQSLTIEITCWGEVLGTCNLTESLKAFKKSM